MEARTPEEIMKDFANEHSYETWGELMYDTHEHTQIEYTKAVMEIFASQPPAAGEAAGGMTECYFTARLDTTSKTICAKCGKEKMLHTIGEGLKASTVIIQTMPSTTAEPAAVQADTFVWVKASERLPENNNGNELFFITYDVKHFNSNVSCKGLARRFNNKWLSTAFDDETDIYNIEWLSPTPWTT